MKKQLSKEDLQTLKDAYNDVERSKRLIQDVADESGVDLDSIIDSLEQAEDELWDVVKEHVLG